ncbi:MAG: DNA repair protein RecN [Rhodospirillaceae bacterium]|nr:DNA repair protein RecN [Rhodospirillaceae bacterium]OUT77044.1 MAG: DNA repair protein RecN [Rhodospirillaceae bacterium TMED23]|tara:strand:- start:39328 stop:40989 length:1662 start_codon:yes stop_codon:yes gene_type:complete
MLLSLSIRNVVLIDYLNINFENGLVVLSGETGSGKSILLDALGLAIGARADADLVRYNSKLITVIAEFQMPNNGLIEKLLNDHGIEMDSALLLKRTVSIEGRSRAFINDQPVNIAFLKRIGELLVEIHGQLETHGLLDPINHRKILDDYGNYPELLESVSRSFKKWKDAQTLYQSKVEEFNKVKKEEEFVRFSVDELVEINPRENDEQLLSDKRSLLMNAGNLIMVTKEAFEQLTNSIEPNLREVIQKVMRSLEKAGGKFDQLASCLERSLLEATEAISEIELLSEQLSSRPDDLEKTEERLFRLRALARKHQVPVSELPELLLRLEKQLATLIDGESNLKIMEEEIIGLKNTYKSDCENLTLTRSKVSSELDDLVSLELHPLKLEAARFVTQLIELPESDWNEYGVESISFKVQTNPNTELGPLNKIASGGELARIMLALKVILADSIKIPTIIFDEVDAGIGGAAAAAVGDRLEKLGINTQVLVITHSPQVASRGNNHFRIIKESDKDGNRIILSPLTSISRTEEIARMLSGSEITDEARAAALKLIKKHI